jgi:hypothetical protein
MTPIAVKATRAFLLPRLSKISESKSIKPILVYVCLNIFLTVL